MSAPTGQITGPFFPANLSRVWLTGCFIDLGGNPMKGKVILTPAPSVLLDRVPKYIISGRPFMADLDPATGSFYLQVPATDDPDVSPVGWTYAVTEPSGRNYNITIPISTPPLNQPGHPLHGQPVIDLIDIVPAPAPASGTVQLIAGRGITSTSIDEDNHLIVAYTDGTETDAGNIGGSSGGATENYVDDAISAHSQAQNPHPEYDDLPSLTLLYQNGLV